MNEENWPVQAAMARKTPVKNEGMLLDATVEKESRRLMADGRKKREEPAIGSSPVGYSPAAGSS
jgi:hypothetical protein